MQAVVVARPVLQQQRRRPRLARAWQRARKAACSAGYRTSMPMRLVPAVGDRREPRVERGAQAARRAPAADRRSTCTRRGRIRAAPSRRGCGSARRRRRAARRRRTPRASAALEHGAAVCVEIGRRRSPVDSFDSRVDVRSGRPVVGAATLMPRLPARAARACARRPSDSPTGAVGAHDAVAGDRHRERVGAAGLRHGAHRLAARRFGSAISA